MDCVERVHVLHFDFVCWEWVVGFLEADVCVVVKAVFIYVFSGNI